MVLLVFSTSVSAQTILETVSCSGSTDWFISNVSGSVSFDGGLCCIAGADSLISRKQGINHSKDGNAANFSVEFQLNWTVDTNTIFFYKLQNKPVFNPVSNSVSANLLGISDVISVSSVAENPCSNKAIDTNGFRIGTKHFNNITMQRMSNGSNRYFVNGTFKLDCDDGNVVGGNGTYPAFGDGASSQTACWTDVIIRSLSPLPPSPSNFDLTAIDLADSTSLTNITARIFNSSFSINRSTVNGTIILVNTSFRFGKLYDIIFSVNDSGGYFNSTNISINITEGGSIEGSLFQSVISLGAVDGLNNLTINSFSALTNLTSLQSTSTGNILILTKAGTYQLNVTADGFDKSITSFTVVALQNLSLNVSLGSIFNFNLIREETNTVFDFNSTNRTKLNIFCPNQTIQIIFNVSSNFSQIINCQFTLMQIVVDYGDLGSYFRTLIPSFTQKNITWYLIDLIAGDTAVQKIIQLLDLTGEFADSTMRIKRSVGGTIRTIIEQQFDISNQVNLFLVKDALYTISIENDAEEIILGNLIPTEAGTQTITLPKIDFVPGETTLGGNISWDYTFNTSQSLLRMQYVDQTNKTTLVRWTIVNDATQSQVFLAESNQNSTVTMTFNQAFGNTSYLSELLIIHPDLSNITDKKVFYEFAAGGEASALNLEGWTLAEQKDIKKWTAFIFLALWGLLFSKLHAGIGMTTMVIWLWLFRTWGWVDVDGKIFAFVAFMAVIGWVVESMRKN